MRLMKLACLLTYALALAATFGVVGGAFGRTIQVIAVLLLAVHAIEALLAFRHVKRYDGSPIASIALTLLFGFLHWAPLARKARRPTA